MQYSGTFLFSRIEFLIEVDEKFFEELLVKHQETTSKRSLEDGSPTSSKFKKSCS